VARDGRPEREICGVIFSLHPQPLRLFLLRLNSFITRLTGPVCRLLFRSFLCLLITSRSRHQIVPKERHRSAPSRTWGSRDLEVQGRTHAQSDNPPFTTVFISRSGIAIRRTQNVLRRRGLQMLLLVLR